MISIKNSGLIIGYLGGLLMFIGFFNLKYNIILLTITAFSLIIIGLLLYFVGVNKEKRLGKKLKSKSWLLKDVTFNKIIFPIFIIFVTILLIDYTPKYTIAIFITAMIIFGLYIKRYIKGDRNIK